MQAGPIRFEHKDDGAQPLAKRVIVRKTGFRMPESFGDRPPIHEVWEHIVNDPARTQLIASDVAASLKKNQIPVIISERKAHLEKIGEAIKTVHNADGSFKILILTGDMGTKLRRAILAELTKSIDEKVPVCLLTTGSLIGEGFDLPRLDALFLTMPISFKGRLIQYAGRLHRSHSDKQEAVVYDYLDDFGALTKSMFKKRLTAYKSMGYRIEGH
jgi:superfamily II DNA or RNA helicase